MFWSTTVAVELVVKMPLLAKASAVDSATTSKNASGRKIRFDWIDIFSPLKNEKRHMPRFVLRPGPYWVAVTAIAVCERKCSLGPFLPVAPKKSKGSIPGVGTSQQIISDGAE